MGLASRIVVLLVLGGLPLAVCLDCEGMAVPKLAVLTVGAGVLVFLRGLMRTTFSWDQVGPVLTMALAMVLLTLTDIMGQGLDGPAARGTFYVLCWSVVFLAVRDRAGGGRLDSAVLWVQAVTANMVACLMIWQILREGHGSFSAERLDLPGIATLGNQNYVAGFLMLSLFPTLVLVRRLRSKNSSFHLAWLILLPQCLGLLMSRSAGALGGAAAGSLCLIGMTVLRSRGVSAGRGFAVAAIVLALGGMVVLGAIVLDSRWVEGTVPADFNLVEGFLLENKVEARAREWWICLSMANGHPLSGVGLNGYKAAWPEYRVAHTEWVSQRLPEGVVLPSPDGPRFTWAHNDWLQLAAEMGWVGLAVLVAMLIWTGALFRRTFRSLAPPLREEMLYFLAGVLALASLSLVSFPWHQPATALAGALLFAGLLPAESSASVADLKLASRWYFKGIFGLLVLLGMVWIAGAEVQSSRNLARGASLQVAGRYPEAESTLRQARDLAIWPDRELVPLGLVMAAQGDFESAVTPLEQSLEVEPTFEALLELARIRSEQGAFRIARDHLAILHGCFPIKRFRVEATYLEAVIAIRCDELSRAEALISELLIMEPEMPRAWLAKGILEKHQGDLVRARESMRKSAQLARSRVGQSARGTASRIQFEQELQAAERSLIQIREGS